MAIGMLMGSHSLAATSRARVLPVGAVQSFGQSSGQRGSTLRPAAATLPSARQFGKCVRRCTPVIRATSSSNASQEVPAAVDSAANPDGLVANETAPRDLARRWNEIAGSNDWQGLLEPLDLTLREEILRYGEFAQATYDTFDFDEHSRYCGSSRYNKDKMFEKVGLFNTGYTITRYIYATADVPEFFLKPEPEVDGEKSWNVDSNWMGYVAVCEDPEKIKQLGRRDIVIAWRGTVRSSEWVANFKAFLHPAMDDKRNKKKVPTIEVEHGFYKLYTTENSRSQFNKTSARTQVTMELQRLLEKYEGEELSITICGHSLGSALATLNAYDIAQLGLNIRDTAWPNSKEENRIPITVFSFAGPRVGNKAFLDRINELGVKVLRMVNVNDVVPVFPGSVLNENLIKHPWMTACFDFVIGAICTHEHLYYHVGSKLELDDTKSPFLDPARGGRWIVQMKESVKAVSSFVWPWGKGNFTNMREYLHLVDNYTQGKCNVHNMEQYLHLVDGYQGRNEAFQPTTGRNKALVNKRCNFLKRDEFIPEEWWQFENKGLVFDKDQGWIVEPRKAEDVPCEEDWLHPRRSTHANLN